SPNLTPVPGGRQPARRRSRMAQKIQEGIIQTLLALAGAFSLAVTVSIIGILSSESIKFFRRDEVSLVQFFFSTHWNPLLGAEKQFGIWPLIAGTFLVTAV